MKPSYQEFDHSGDIGIEAWGSSPAELLENLSRGLLGLISRNPVSGSSERRIRVASESLEDLVIDWLSEIITAVDLHGEVYGSVIVETCQDGRAEGAIKGVRYDPNRHQLRLEVKAATYHGLTVKRDGDRYHARVIFDL